MMLKPGDVAVAVAPGRTQAGEVVAVAAARVAAQATARPMGSVLATRTEGFATGGAPWGLTIPRIIRPRKEPPVGG